MLEVTLCPLFWIPRIDESDCIIAVMGNIYIHNLVFINSMRGLFFLGVMERRHAVQDSEHEVGIN